MSSGSESSSSPGASGHSSTKMFRFALNVFTLPPAFFLLHATHGIGTAYAGMCVLLERILPHGIFRKETPTQRA